MRRRGTPVPSPAMAVAVIALFVALGGTSFALGRADRAAPSAPKRTSTPSELNARQRAQVRAILRSESRRLGLTPVALRFDRSPDDQVVTLGVVGPWTISARCVVGGVVVPAPLQVFVDGPGTAETGTVVSFNDGAATATTAHNVLAADRRIFSIGVRSRDHAREVGTMVLSAGSGAPVASIAFTITSGGTARRCAFSGTATVAP
ncbi:MAG: hypothetical protein JWQ48_2760 [Conexibacter sp.]|nr:hypothetical protein [Conexibacter sp.]